MKTIKEMTAVMQAYADGKKIEYRKNGSSGWFPTVNPNWNWFEKDYRVKSEPKYRPYKDADECFTDVKSTEVG